MRVGAKNEKKKKGNRITFEGEKIYMVGYNGGINGALVSREPTVDCQIIDNITKPTMAVAAQRKRMCPSHETRVKTIYNT